MKVRRFPRPSQGDRCASSFNLCKFNARRWSAHGVGSCALAARLRQPCIEPSLQSLATEMVE